MPCPTARLFALLAGLLLVSASVVAQQVDPVELLKRSAAAVGEAQSASVEFAVTIKQVRNAKVDEQTAAFLYRTAPGERFEFDSVAPEGAEGPKFGYRVAGNGGVTLTAIYGARRHMLQDNQDGFAAFVRSRGAMGIGSGLGGMALAFLHPAAMEDLAASVLKSEVLGEDEIDGERLIHARYTVEGGITSDVWFRAEGEPLVRRIEPDVLSTPAIQEMAKQFDKFDYQVRFDFNDWNPEAGFAAEDIRVIEPKDSLLMTSLFEPPAPKPYSLLGAEAPAFDLTTPEGERVSLTEAKGEGAVLLEFWATTCPICVQAMPQLERLHEQYAERGLDYYAINVGEAPADVAAFLEQRGLTPTALIDQSMDVGTAYDVVALPLILLVGPEGRVQVAQEGFRPETPEKLAAQIEAILEGEDLAAEQVAKLREAEEARLKERERLRSRLDG
ncbi:Thiol-disulfide oxidoreductase ResA [Planctomycetes bacterium MalM25]|nr:Thiol-disulfide oxidoreductase ResA [Planctomycetes bacterium MalM25]